MLSRRNVLLGTAGVIPALSAAKAFPDRPIILATGYAPGGSTDIASRIVAERLSSTLGSGAKVVVENRPGAGGVLASEWLKRQDPDGYTLALVETASHAVVPAAMTGGTRYNPLKDFTVLAIVGTSPILLAVNNDFPAQSVEDVIANLRQGPADRLNYATSGVGTMPHLASEMLALNLKTRFVHVPYRSGGQMMQAILQNHCQFGMPTLPSAAGQVRGGLVRAVAVTGHRRFPSFPEVPTLEEGGLTGYDLPYWNLIIGPAGMAPDLVARLNTAIVAALTTPVVKSRLLDAGLEAWSEVNGPSDGQHFLETEVARYRDIVERTGVRLSI